MQGFIQRWVPEYVRTEASEVSKAPAAAAVVFLLGLWLGWVVAGRHYEQEIAELGATIGTLQANLEVQRDIIEDREQRLGMRPQDDRFSKLNDEELIAETMALVKDVRAFHWPFSRRATALYEKVHQEQHAVPAPKDGTRLEFERWRAELDQAEFAYKKALYELRHQYAEEFNERFSARAFSYHDELLKRLSPDIDHPHIEDDLIPEKTAPGTGDLIAMDLEALVLKLKSKRSPS